MARIADEMLCMGAADAERYLGAQIRIQRSTMARRGIADEAAGRELRALETAIRARLWRLILTPDGAA